MNIKQTKEGWHIIEGDTHHGKWIEDSGKLDHDEFLIPFAVQHVPPDGVVIDCGALYGDHTIAYCRKASSQGMVIAIEANPTAFICLQKNAEKFQSPTLLINGAVGEEHGGKAIHQIHEGNIGMSIVTEEDKKGIEIPTLSIDGLVRDSGLTRLDFIKLDVEGFEFKVLKGARGVLKTLRPRMLIEINSFALEAQGAKDHDIYELLLASNYSWRIAQSDCTGSSPQFDILCWSSPIKIEEKRLIL